MLGHVAFNLGFEARHGLSAGHEVGDLFASFLALAEVGRDCSADQYREVIAYRHGMHHLVGNEDHSKATLLCLVDDAQEVGNPINQTFLPSDRDIAISSSQREKT